MGGNAGGQSRVAAARAAAEGVTAQEANTARPEVPAPGQQVMEYILGPHIDIEPTNKAIDEVLDDCFVDQCVTPLKLRQHARFLLFLGSDGLSLESFMAVPMKMGGAYWASSALWLMGLTSRKTQGLLAQAVALRSACSGEQAPIQQEVHGGGGAGPAHPTALPPTATGLQQTDKKTVEDDPDGKSSSSSESAVPALDRALEAREDAICEWVLKCARPCGGFAQDVGHDAHIASTHYAVLLLMGLGRLHLLPDRRQTATWVRGLQTPDGGFRGDQWGEVDSRYSYCGVACLALLGELDSEVAAKAVHFVRQLLNHDGGFAWVPGGESHAASAFCCLATLALCEGLWAVNRKAAAEWLIERQTPGGGFNGRPEKAPDVCYSFWICASLQILGYGRWVDVPSLSQFILDAQEQETGGIADRPGDMADVFHTFFGFAALGMNRATPHLQPLHPILALPSNIVTKLQLPASILW